MVPAAYATDACGSVPRRCNSGRRIFWFACLCHLVYVRHRRAIRMVVDICQYAVEFGGMAQLNWSPDHRRHHHGLRWHRGVLRYVFGIPFRVPTLIPIGLVQCSSTFRTPLPFSLRRSAPLWFTARVSPLIFLLGLGVVLDTQHAPEIEHDNSSVGEEEHFASRHIWEALTDWQVWLLSLIHLSTLTSGASLSHRFL